MPLDKTFITLLIIVGIAWMFSGEDEGMGEPKPAGPPPPSPSKKRTTQPKATGIQKQVSRVPEEIARDPDIGVTRLPDRLQIGLNRGIAAARAQAAFDADQALTLQTTGQKPLRVTR